MWLFKFGVSIYFGELPNQDQDCGFDWNALDKVYWHFKIYKIVIINVEKAIR